MASEDLLKKAVAAFKTLSTEQQAEMLEEQRQSWVRGNVGLSRDERGMTSPVMPRPESAATDTVSKDGTDGLVTVGRRFLNNQGQISSGDHKECVSLGFRCYELVTRPQAESEIRKVRKDAEELLAENAELIKDRHFKQYIIDGLVIDKENLKADNAALTARIKELERINANLMGDDEDKPRYTTKRLKLEIARATEVLEAKLAAAENALEPFADIADLIDAETEGMDETDELVLHFHDYEFAKWPVSLFRKARAARRGKS